MPVVGSHRHSVEVTIRGPDFCVWVPLTAAVAGGDRQLGDFFLLLAAVSLALAGIHRHWVEVHHLGERRRLLEGGDPDEDGATLPGSTRYVGVTPRCCRSAARSSLSIRWLECCSLQAQRRRSPMGYPVATQVEGRSRRSARNPGCPSTCSMPTPRPGRLPTKRTSPRRRSAAPTNRNSR